jgi:hypothetical protein
MEITRDRLFGIHLEACARAFQIMLDKNRDYATDADALMNFRDEAGRALPAIISRLQDKRARLARYVEKGGFAVTNETFVDTCLDGINYFVLALAAFAEISTPELSPPVPESPVAPPGADLPTLANIQARIDALQVALSEIVRLMVVK